MSGSFTAVASDATGVFFNPGSLVLLDPDYSISAAGIFAISKSSFLSEFDGNINALNTKRILPQLFGAMRINEQFSAGIGFYSPFSYHTKWDDSWEGRYVSQESDLLIQSIHPVVSYRINEKLGAGAGLIYSFGKWDQTMAVAAGGADGSKQLNGTGTSIGINAGLYFQYSENLQLAATYRMAGNFKIKNGEYSFVSIPSSLSDQFPSSGKYNVQLNLPPTLTLAAAYHFTDELLTTFELNASWWSRLKSAEFISDEDSTFSYTRDFGLENSLSGRVGIQYSFTDEFDVRGGFAYEISPFNSVHLLPEFPDADKIIFSAGASLDLSSNFSADISAGIENFFERQGSDVSASMNGTFKTIRYFAGLSINYNF